MAESVAYAFLKPVLELLGSSIVTEFGLLWGVKEELDKLSSFMSAIQSVLQDAEEKQIHSYQVRDWMTKLKDVTYDAEDILDEFATEALRSKVETSKWKQVCNFFLSCFGLKSLQFRYEISHKIKDINEKLERIAKERNDLHLRDGDGGLRLPEVRTRLEAISLIHESDVFGRENDKEKLINLLVSDGSVAKELSVIPIVGMGGVGKTTIAQLIYNDKRVVKHFDMQGWVCVSEDFNLKRLTKAIIESISKQQSSNYEELSPLAEEIQKIVSGKKFLLVLDDVWNEDSKKWEVLRAPLRCGAKGSKILVTTRSENVSRIMGTIHGYPLGILSDEDCWLLLGKRAFPTESWDEHPDLVVFGKKIAKKCRGIPLAAKTLGGVLQGTKQERKWKDILNSEIWKLPQGGEDDILNSLRLSYHHLPAHLKQCFLYCSIFPKDYEFEKEKLVKLWMGEGFITSNVEQMEMEDVGCDYFDELLCRSFFQYRGKEEDGKLMYNMHGLIHDLAQSLSEGECFRVEDEKLIDFPEKARYASHFTHIANDLTMFEQFLKCKRLHTLLMSQEFGTESVPTNLFQQMKFLRVLELDCNEMTELPDSIGNLKHLRYFALSSKYIKGLPESVSSFYNLQTLDLSGCIDLVELPKDTRNLINLRHLTFPTFQMNSTPEGIGRLTCLRTLSKFVVGKDSGHEIGQLMKLINLKRRLQISGLQNVVNAEEVVWDNKEYIEELYLSWEGYQSVSIAEKILERFQPHPNLRILNIEGYNGERFPSWIGDPSFSKLEEVVIRDCKSCQTLPPRWQLRSLKKLSIDNCKELVTLDEGLQYLVSLQEMHISNLPQLASLPDGLKNLISLKYLKIGHCERLATLPKEGLPSTLQTLDIYSCPLQAEQLRKISHIPNLYSDFWMFP